MVRGVANTHARAVRSAVGEPQLALADALTRKRNRNGLADEFCERTARISDGHPTDEITLNRQQMRFGKIWMCFCMAWFRAHKPRSLKLG